MYTVYIIQSVDYQRLYIGYTSNIEKRLEYHNKGTNRSTRPYRPYKLIYNEIYQTKTEALKREKKLKSYKNSKYVLELTKSRGGGVDNRTRL